MKLSSQIRPISYLKAHAAEIVRTLAAQPAGCAGPSGLHAEWIAF